jgi:hypothetical protein
MSQVKSISVFAVLFALLFTFSGCGEVNNETFDPDDGHPAGWLPSGHKAAVAAEDEGVAECAECHGADLGGGNAKVSCTKCHLGGTTRVHPADWYDGSGKLIVAGKHSAYVGTNGNTSCSNANCHGATFQGVTGSGPACTKCHLASETNKHASGYSSHSNGFLKDGGIYKTYPPSRCANINCHGADFAGVTGSGTSCFDCHHQAGKKTNGCLGCHDETKGKTTGGTWGY